MTTTTRQIMINTEGNWPNFCFEVLPVSREGEKGKLPKGLYASVASSFGWSINAVQVCRRCGKPLDLSAFMDAKIEEVGTDGMDSAREEQEQWEAGELAVRCESCGFKKSKKLGANTWCEHNGDGTVPCKTCGAKTGDFLSAAYDFIMANDGLTADDPGYFDED